MVEKYMYILENPSDCFECVLSGMLHRGNPDEPAEEIPYCRAADEYLNDDFTKPEWCPLKSVPQKKDRNTYNEHYCDGFNDCLDEILDEN
jgi:hypothetical protein